MIQKITTLSSLLLVAGQTRTRTLEMFILAGQSNMKGHAKIEAFDHIFDNPATAPLRKQRRGEDRRPAVCDHVGFSYFPGVRENYGDRFGKLIEGYDSRQKPYQDGGMIGPAFTFGLAMDQALQMMNSRPSAP